MATSTDEQLLRIVLPQLKGKIDFDVVARELGLSKGAAEKRWSRFKIKIMAEPKVKEPEGTLSDAGEFGSVSKKRKASEAGSELSAREAKEKKTEMEDEE